MKSLCTILLVFAVMFVSGCTHYSDISGNVVDSVTGKPIQGALVVVQWTKTRGIPGMQYHDLHKIAETLTNKDGAFSLGGAYGFFINPPEMIIFKDGFLPWRNDSIFPSSNIVKNNEWHNYASYKLEVLTDKYTARQMWSFMDSGIIGRGGKETPIFTELMHKIHKIK